MKRFGGAACLLAFTAGLAIGSGQIESKQAPRDASADTDPNSDFWRGATPVLAEGDREGNPVPGHRTEIRSRWTGRNLYFLFTCPYEQLNLKPEPKTETETNQLWKWDVAEVFIGSDVKNIRRYKEFEISPHNSVVWFCSEQCFECVNFASELLFQIIEGQRCRSGRILSTYA